LEIESIQSSCCNTCANSTISNTSDEEIVQDNNSQNKINYLNSNSIKIFNQYEKIVFELNKISIDMQIKDNENNIYVNDFTIEIEK